jgi:hypothetical protein
VPLAAALIASGKYDDIGSRVCNEGGGECLFGTDKDGKVVDLMTIAEMALNETLKSAHHWASAQEEGTVVISHRIDI